MAGSFSLVEKIAVSGAFCAIVAMGIGTESDPGVIAEQKVATDAAPRTRDAAAPREATAARSAYWRRDPGEAPSGLAAPPEPAAPPEILPPGFGAAPSPDLPM